MKEGHKDLCDYWQSQSPPSEAFFSDVVGPYLISISQRRDYTEISRFFQFIDSISGDNKDLIDVGVVSVIEDIPEVKSAVAEVLGSDLEDMLSV